MKFRKRNMQCNNLWFLPKNDSIYSFLIFFASKSCLCLKKMVWSANFAIFVVPKKKIQFNLPPPDKLRPHKSCFPTPKSLRSPTTVAVPQGASGRSVGTSEFHHAMCFLGWKKSRQWWGETHPILKNIGSPWFHGYINSLWTWVNMEIMGVLYPRTCATIHRSSSPQPLVWGGVCHGTFRPWHISG